MELSEFNYLLVIAAVLAVVLVLALVLALLVVALLVVALVLDPPPIMAIGACDSSS